MLAKELRFEGTKCSKDEREELCYCAVSFWEAECKEDQRQSIIVLCCFVFRDIGCKLRAVYFSACLSLSVCVYVCVCALTHVR